MRQIFYSSRRCEGASTVTAKAPIVEGIKRKPRIAMSAELKERIIQRRGELMQEGLQDKTIARRIGQEMGIGWRKIHQLFMKLNGENKIPRNPNKRTTIPFTKHDIATIRQRREELIEDGMNDAQLARIIAKEMERNPLSVDDKIRDLVKQERFVENPNNTRIGKRIFWNNERIEQVGERRDELIEEGMNDARIAKVIAKERGYTKGGTYLLIRNLVKQGDFEENPNYRKGRKLKKQKRRAGWYTVKEDALIKRRRSELIKQGMNDTDAGRELANEMKGRTAAGILCHIAKLVRLGTIEQNPNNIERRNYSHDEVERIINRREELIALGWREMEIFDSLAEELDRTRKKILEKVAALRRAGKIGENPNRGERKDEKLARRVIQKRIQLMKKGFNDTKIAREIAKKEGIAVTRTRRIIDESIEKGQAEENPFNKPKDLTTAQINILFRRRKRYVGQGATDFTIAKTVAGELQVGHWGLYRKLRMAEDVGEIPINPHNNRSKRK